MESPKRAAFRDITEDLIARNFTIRTRGDIWCVSVTSLDTKYSRRLNRDLGIHKVNKHTPHNKQLN